MPAGPGRKCLRKVLDGGYRGEDTKTGLELFADMTDF